MAEVILMPRLSDTMTEGVIAAWHKNVGDTVKKGDLLAEIETDKATMELESYQAGVLLHIGTPAGGKLQVNDLLAILGKAGEDITGLIANPTGAAAPAKKGFSDKSLLWIFIAAFGGGLLALLTPCVYSMIPVTVSFFTKRSKTKKS